MFRCFFSGGSQHVLVWIHRWGPWDQQLQNPVPKTVVDLINARIRWQEQLANECPGRAFESQMPAATRASLAHAGDAERMAIEAQSNLFSPHPGEIEFGQVTFTRLPHVNGREPILFGHAPPADGHSAYRCFEPDSMMLGNVSIHF